MKTLICNSSKSKLVTMIHGDFWKNNMLFSEDDNKVCFIDFQMLAINHPANDFWYFLSICTDSKWRRENLESVIKAYFNVFIEYYARVPGLPDLTFGEFRAEIERQRPTALILGAEVLPNVLSPNEINVHLFVMNDLKRKRAAEICGEDIEITPEIAEIRRRLIDLVEEAAAFNII